MKLRILNSAGMSEASSVLDRIRSGELENIPAEFLGSDDFSRETALEVRNPTSSEIQNRWFLGVWLWQKLTSLSEDSSVISDPGLWTWLAFFLFDTIAPVRARGRNVHEDARYILARGDY